jgi:hypothetical protein
MEDITTRFINVYKHLIEKKIIENGNKFAVAIGISPSLLTEIKKGRNDVGLKAIQNTVLKFDFLNPHWLLTGLGNMEKNIIESENKSHNAEMIIQLKYNIDLQKKVIENLENELVTLKRDYHTMYNPPEHELASQK